MSDTGLQNPLRAKSKLQSDFKLIWVVQIATKKYFAFAVGQISANTPAVSCPQEGRFAIVTDVGHGMRWTFWRQARSFVVLDESAEAYGQVVWS